MNNMVPKTLCIYFQPENKPVAIHTFIHNKLKKDWTASFFTYTNVYIKLDSVQKFNFRLGSQTKARPLIKKIITFTKIKYEIRNCKFDTKSIFLVILKHIFNISSITYALSFYRSQNVLCWSKFFEPAQKFDCI